ncbi:MAG: GNAT family N-acetyltransferase [Treponema sp.]|jgi:GNAT superfamily N-acetyltransferase|nr:GNAT family N-acetyltransferase [Treponema sp.]
MENVNIRKGVLSDIPYLYEICLKTGNNGKDASDLFFDPFLIGQYYAAPYLAFHYGICFVAEYQYRVQGYILGVPDTVSFEKWMEEQWLPPLRQRYPKPFSPEIVRSEKEAWILDNIHKKRFPVNAHRLDTPSWLSDYPAHLHIDILSVLQGKGIGRKLMEKLFTELEKQRVPGLHLGVSSSNPGAVGFYKKFGFSVLEEESWGYTMGIKIDECGDIL